MKKTLGRVSVPSQHDTPDRVEAQLAARMGKAKTRIAEVLRAMIEQFYTGGSHAHLLAQYGFGVEFQKLAPKLVVYAQQNPHAVPEISIKASDIADEDSELAPGFNYNARKRRIITREAGMAPCEIKIIARSESEISVMENSLKRIFGQLIMRLYNGVIYNPEANWQVCFAKTMELQTASEEVPQNAQGLDENYLISILTFNVYYESAHMEQTIKKDAVVVPGAVPLTITDTGINPAVYLGERRDYRVQSDRKLVTYYLEDSSLGRLYIDESGLRLTLIALKRGKCKLVVKNGKAEAATEIEVV